MCVADYDNDGHKDVFSGGSYDGVFVQHITSPGVSESLSLSARLNVYAMLQLG